MTLEKLISSATVLQRAVLGFPRPGHRYWTAATLQAVKARYLPLGFDPRPYEEALSLSSDEQKKEEDRITLQKENQRLKNEIEEYRRRLNLASVGSTT